MGYSSPLASSFQVENLGFGTGVGVTITSNSVANTKGVYASIGGATSFDYDGMLIGLSAGIAGGTAGRRFRVDLAVNNGGSDQIIAEDLLLEINNAIAVGSAPSPVFLPVAVSKGAQIKARCQDSAGGGTVSVALSGMSGGASVTRGFQKLACLTDWTNSDPANSLTLTGTTQTGWAQVMASTPRRIAGIYVMFDGKGNASLTSTSLIIDIGWGASGSERALTRALYGIQSGVSRSFMGPVPCDIPVATRLAWRAQASGADTNSVALALWGLVP